MALGTSSIISIVELVAYVPAIVLACFVCSRHGFSRSSGWYYTFTLCLVRIVGSVCQLLSLSNASSGLLKAVLILNHIGLTPLLLATLGMLSRIVDWINARHDSPLLSIKIFRLAQLFVVLGAVLGIIGSANTTSESPSIWTHIAVLCYLVTYLILAFLWVRSLASTSLIPDNERLLVPAVSLALPLVFVRLLYQILLVFIHRGAFVRINGPILILIFMSAVEEFLVVAIFLFMGWKLDPLSEDEQGPIASRPWKNRGKEPRRKRRERRERRGDYHNGSYSTSDGYPMH